jgi:hypothetical protein
MTSIDLIKTFCSTQDIEIFKKLPQHTQHVFQKMSKFAIDNNVGYLGLAYIILNYMNNKYLYKKPNFIYGVHEIHLFSSEKYNMKLLVLGDSHKLDYNCPKNYVNQQMSVVDFITQEIINSDSFIDLYLELPYILKDIKTAPELVDSYIRRTQLKFDNCFTWSKTLCQYPHLRAHYTDLRYATGNKYFQELIKYTARIYFNKIPQIMIKVYGYDIVNNESLEKIFETKETLIKYVQGLIMESKIGKQIDNIKDPILREKVLEQINIWIETPNDIDDISIDLIHWDNLKWSYIQEAINTNNIRMINNIYLSLTAYSGVTMDAYLLARMFRNYTSIKNKNSSRATNIILYAGSYHTNRYVKFIKNILHFTENYKEIYYDEKNCINISSMKLPIFSSDDDIISSDDKCKNKVCDRDKICNPKTGRCVLKTGKIGKTI